MKQGLKYAILAIGPIALVAGIIFSMRGGPQLADTVTFVNIYTGETQRVSMSDAPIEPQFDDQGRPASFIAIAEDRSKTFGESDRIFIRERSREAIRGYIAEGKIDPEQVIIDLDTFEVLRP